MHPVYHPHTQICYCLQHTSAAAANANMSVLQHIVQHAQISGLVPALGAVQQQWRGMSLYNNPDWKYHFKYGVNSERGEQLALLGVVSHAVLRCFMACLPHVVSADLDADVDAVAACLQTSWSGTPRSASSLRTLQQVSAGLRHTQNVRSNCTCSMSISLQQAPRQQQQQRRHTSGHKCLSCSVVACTSTIPPWQEHSNSSMSTHNSAAACWQIRQQQAVIVVLSRAILSLPIAVSVPPVHHNVQPHACSFNPLIDSLSLLVHTPVCTHVHMGHPSVLLAC